MTNEVVIGEIIIALITIGLPLLFNYLFKWSEKHGLIIAEEEKKYIIDAATRGTVDVWRTYTKNIKTFSYDGRLTENEMKEARKLALKKTKGIITEKFYKKYTGDIEKLIDGVMEKAYLDAKEKLPEVNANEEVEEGIDLALKIIMTQYQSKLARSLEKGEIPENLRKDIVDDVLAVAKNFIADETMKRIDDNAAGNREKVTRVILKEVYEQFLDDRPALHTMT